MSYDADGNWVEDYGGQEEDQNVGSDQFSTGDPSAYSATDTSAAGSPSWLNSFLKNLGGNQGILSKLSPVLGSAAAARNTQENTQIAQLLQQARLQQTGPANRLATGVRASLAANAQPVTNDFTPGSGKAVHFSGGLTPSALSPEAKQLANDVMHQTIQQQLQGDTIPQIGDESTLDQILGIGSAAAGIGGALTARNNADTARAGSETTTAQINKGLAGAGILSKVLPGAAGAIGQVASAAALPLGIAKIGDLAGWWGPNSWDNGASHSVPGGFVANDLPPDELLKGVANTGEDQVIKDQADQGYA